MILSLLSLGSTFLLKSLCIVLLKAFHPMSDSLGVSLYLTYSLGSSLSLVTLNASNNEVKLLMQEINVKISQQKRVHTILENHPSSVYPWETLVEAYYYYYCLQL